MRDARGRFSRGHNWKGGLPKCLDCGKQLSDYRNKRCRSCSSSYVMSNIRDISGKNNPFYGKKHSQETKNKISNNSKVRIGINAPNWKGGKSKKYRKCIDCGGNINDHNSSRCRECYDKFNRGSNHWNWAGGKTSLNKLIRGIKEYSDWREEVFKRDNYTCQECGVRGQFIEAHHKKEFHVLIDKFINKYKQFSTIDDIETLARLSITYEPFWDVDNGMTLCSKCHAITKNGYPKRRSSKCAH